MNQQANEDYTIVIESFSTISDCTDYFYSEFSKLATMHERDIFSNKEYKSKKKYLMNQFNANLKLLKQKDKVSRNQESIILKQQSKPQFAPEPTQERAKIPTNEQYQIEDKEETNEEN